MSKFLPTLSADRQAQAGKCQTNFKFQRKNKKKWKEEYWVDKIFSFLVYTHPVIPAFHNSGIILLDFDIYLTFGF